jgi:hypothetical protein
MTSLDLSFTLKMKAGKTGEFLLEYTASHPGILYAFLFSPIHAAFAAHLILYLIILIILGEEYKL